MAGRVWGEGNTNAFLAWADQCQKEAIQERGLRLNLSSNFSNISSPEAIDAKNKISDILRSNRQISVLNLYKLMPPTICANPTTKTLIMQLYYENNLQIESSQSANGREANFVLIFQNKPRQEQKIIQTPKKNITLQQSNIEELIDDNWKASGRKLKFDDGYYPEKTLNTSLKNPKPINPRVVNQKPVQDVRDFLKNNIKAPLSENKTPPQQRPIKIESPIEAPKVIVNIPKMDLPTIDIKPIEVPVIKIEPMTEVPKQTYTSNLEFAGLTAFELYLLELFFLDCSVNEPNKQRAEHLRTNSKLCKAKGDVVYLETEPKKNGFVRLLLGILCIFIVTIPALIAYNKNKLRSTAKKEYLRLSKKTTLPTRMNNFKNKYPKVVK